MRPAEEAWKPAVSVLNALTQIACGALAELTAAAEESPRLSTPKPLAVRPNWLVVSMTSFPARAPGPPACSIAVSTIPQGTEKTTTSACLTAPARVAGGGPDLGRQGRELVLIPGEADGDVVPGGGVQPGQVAADMPGADDGDACHVFPFSMASMLEFKH